ncbi:MAG: hypothetical protein ACHP8B_05770 [Terriglobales bacterium]
MKVSAFVAIVLWSSLCLGQEVHVSRGNGTVSLSVAAQKPYQLMSGEQKLPTLSVECTQKGKKTGHLLIFLPGGTLAEDLEVDAKGGQRPFAMTIGGTREITAWVGLGDAVTFSYFAKTDAERLKFIQSLLNAGKVSIEFKPFLSGTPTTSVFDLSKLRGEMDKYPECAATK